MADKNLGALLEELVTGSFAKKFIFILSLPAFLDGGELSLISILIPRLKCTWGLNDVQSGLMSSSVFLGMSLGSLFWGWLSDRHGRKRLLLLSICIVMYFGFLTAVTFEYTLFIATRFFVGFGTGAGTVFAGAYIAEYVSNKSRGQFMIAANLLFATGGVYVALIAYIFMNNFSWKMFTVMVSIVTPAVLLAASWLPESVRYLESNGQFEDVMKILHRLSHETKKLLPGDIKLKRTKSFNKGCISELFSKQFRKTSVCLIFLWMAVLAEYFMVALLNTELMQSSICSKWHIYKSSNKTSNNHCHKLSNSEYLQNVLTTCGGVVGILLLALFVDRVGRKSIMFVASIINAVFLFVISLCVPFYVYSVAMFIVRAFCVVNTTTIWLYTLEYYPTYIRATGLGLCSCCARGILVLVPYIVQTMFDFSFHLLVWTFVVLSVICALLTLLLKETKGVMIS